MRFCLSKKRIDIFFMLFITIYLASGILLMKFYQYQLSPDGVSYITIAQKYLCGDFRNAINGVWGPLISWLLLPLISLRLDPLLAAKALNLVLGMITLIGVRRLSYRFQISENIITAILLSLIPVILSFAFSSVTPDLLVVCILVFYFSVIFNADYADKSTNSLFCGMIGGFLYLAKHYGFPFFISHFIMMNTFYYATKTNEDKKKIIRSLILGFISFFIISGIWAYLLSKKYKEITIGTEARIVFASKSPDWPSKTVRLERLIDPPNETALSAWEDYSFLAIKKWHPAQSLTDLKHYVKLILNNIYDFLDICRTFSPLLLVILAAYIIICVQPIKKVILQGEVLYPFSTLILYSSGFVLIGVLFRYIWIDYILLMLMGGYLMDKLFLLGFFNDLRKKMTIVFFILFFSAFAFNNLANSYNRGKDVFNLAKKLKIQFNIEGNMASNKNWGEMTELSYYMKNKYYGAVGDNIRNEELKNELKEHEIDYFFVWGESKCASQFSLNWHEITKGQIPGLKIYICRKSY